MADSADPSPFRDAAAYYDRFRPPYAPAALEHVVSALGLDGGARVLDLGCGPGTIAIPLSRVVAEVVAVDPDGAMLAEGRRLAAEQGRGNIRWIQARAEDLAPDLGPFRAATLGQSLHWMDRDRVLAQLADLIEEGGGLAIVDEGQAHRPESWVRTAAAIAASYVGRRPRHPGKHPEVDHAPSLGRSRHFADVTVREFPHEITRDIASVLGCVYSGINATRPMFGDRAPAFEAELTDALLRLAPAGLFHEPLETAVFVAMKRAAA
jgi:ubiquinone/menaquinone biosynthesis C-methylase UbiE